MHTYIYHRIKDLWPQAIGWCHKDGFFCLAPPKRSLDILVYESEATYLGQIESGQACRCVAVGYAGEQLTVSGDPDIVYYLKNLPLLYDRPICHFEAVGQHGGSPLPVVQPDAGLVAAS